MFYIGFLKFKKWVIRSFPLFWWVMLANRSSYRPKMSDVSKSLRSLTKHELPWAIRSGCSPKMSNVSKWLRSLTKHERPWAIRSGRSPNMSDHERFTHVALQKWTNERIARFFEQIAHSLILGKKQAICSENQWANSQLCYFLYFLPLFSLWLISISGQSIDKRLQSIPGSASKMWAAPWNAFTC